ncbi:hypothetical protein HN747_04780 [archaeon]|nr:hypothetical protein [archaeon]
MAQNRVQLCEKKLVILFLGLFLLTFALGQETNLTDQEYSRQCLFDSATIMSDLQVEGFNVFRINDSLMKAQTIYDSQVLIERQRRSGEYTTVISTCEEIAVLYDLALKSRDDIGVFEGFYTEVVVDGMDTTEVDLLIEQILKEINDERYEKVEPLVEESYAAISEAQEKFTRESRFYTATTRNVTILLKEYGIYFGIFLIALFVIYLAYRVKIRRVLLNRKINGLRLRKKSIQLLMSKTQKEYFQSGKLSESDYQLRSKNFANLVRDIDRQIPLLEEKLIKSSKDKKNNDRIKEISRKERNGHVKLKKRFK